MELDIGKPKTRQVLTESRVIYSQCIVGTDNQPISFGNGNLSHKTRLRGRIEWENYFVEMSDFVITGSLSTI